MVLARLRQLSAHEVGHTLGLQHNYAASPVARASVMDYPAPRAVVGADGVPDLLRLMLEVSANGTRSQSLTATRTFRLVQMNRLH